MRMAVWLAALVAIGFVAAQSAQSQQPKAPSHSDNRDQVTISGCVSRFNGDYVLMKQDPGVSYQLESTRKIPLKSYLGKQVRITGTESPTMSTSEDALNKVGSASSVTISVRSVEILSPECQSR